MFTRLVFVIALSIIIPHELHAVVSWGEQIITVHDLPDTTENQSELGEQLDLGIKTGQVQFLFLMPIWNYGEEEYVFTVEGDADKYYECLLTSDELESWFDDMDESLPGLGFWNRFGGKIVAVIVALIGMAFSSVWRGGGTAAAPDDGPEAETNTEERNS